VLHERACICQLDKWNELPRENHQQDKLSKNIFSSILIISLSLASTLADPERGEEE